MCEEIKIPIHRDSRTFEEYHKSFLNNLERNFQKKVSSSSNTSSTACRSSTSKLDAHRCGEELPNRQQEDWNDQVDQWVKEMRSDWDDKMQRIRQQFQTLDFDDTFRSSSNFGKWFRDDPTEDREDKLENEFKSLFGKESKSSSQSSRSHLHSSSYSTNSKVNNSRSDRLDESDFFRRKCNPFAKMSSPSWSGSNNWKKKHSGDLGRDLYELGEDGQSHYKVRFDVHEFSPEHIRVTTEGRRLKVNAKFESKTETNSQYSEFSRVVELPDCIDHERFKCHLTKDGILEIDAPVKINKSGNHCHTVHFDSNVTSSGGEKRLLRTGKSGITVMNHEDGRKKIHLEMTVEEDYCLHEITVRAKTHKIIVEGKHEEKCGGRSFMKQFTKTFEVSEVLDVSSKVRYDLQNGCLIVEILLDCN